MNPTPLSSWHVKRKISPTAAALGSILMLLCFSTFPITAHCNDEYAEDEYETSESYPQNFDDEPGYSDEQNYDSEEIEQIETQMDNYNAYEDPSPDMAQPVMDNELAEMVRNAKASCSQWAAESGLEGEDMQTFIDDCVYSQTGQ